MLIRARLRAWRRGKLQCTLPVSPTPETGRKTVFLHPERRLLRAVTTLADELSFTRAAHKLNISQSGLSRRITRLEQRLGFQPVTRSNKRVMQLTDAGCVFVRGARSALTVMELAVRRARAAQEGKWQSPCPRNLSYFYRSEISAWGEVGAWISPPLTEVLSDIACGC
jgi:hypothetical protein